MRKEHEAIITDLQENVVSKWSDEQVDHFFLTGWGETEFIQYHHNFGRYIRNNYNLWEIDWEPELINGVDHSLEHPDNISQVLIKELWKRGKNFKENT